MIEQMAQDQAKRFFGRIWEDTLGYLRLHEYLKLRASEVAGIRPVRISSVLEFWHGTLGDRFGRNRSRYQQIRNGDVVRIRGGFLTEWAPKLPGRLWTSDGVTDLAQGLRMVEGRRRYGDEMYTILDPYGKRRVLDAGHGTVRLARGDRNSDHFAYMALVDEEFWNCDYGIPIVVSRPVFEEFQRRSKHGAPAVRSLEGIVRTGSDIPLSQLIPRAIGAELSKASEDSLRLRPGLPRCYVHVVSPLSVKLLHNGSHPDITAWTMYSTRTDKRDPFRDAFGYSYVSMNPQSPGAHQEAAAFLQHYAADHGGTRLVTDYDGIEPRLSAEIPLTSDPLSRSKAAVKKVLRGIDKWAATVVERNRRRLW